MTDESIEWKVLIDAARTPESVAWLYKHAETHLRHTSQLPDIANKLGKIFHASKNNRPKNSLHLKLKSEKDESHRIEFVSTEGRAIDICSAIGLSTKTGRQAPPPSAEQLMASGLANDLALFIAERFEAAQNAAVTAQNAKYRARAVTTALRLNHPVGAPPSRQRWIRSEIPQKTILVKCSSVILGNVAVECYDDINNRHPSIPPEVFIASIDAMLEAHENLRKQGNADKPPRFDKVCEDIAIRYGRDPIWVELLYYRERSRTMALKKCRN